MYDHHMLEPNHGSLSAKDAKIEYCKTCDTPMLRCPKCQNNCCNAGYGEVDGKQCDLCPEVYALQDAMWESGEILKLQAPDKSKS